MQAVILAAGMGRRLGQLTESQTKCMVKLHGSTLLERSLDAITATGVSRIVIVVGYQAEGVCGLIGNSYEGVPVSYIENPDYATTNNIYSLFLAKDELESDDTLLLESDIVYDPKILYDLLEYPAPNVAVVARHRSWMDGTVVTISDDNLIQQFVPVKKIDKTAYGEYYKTVNIYKFSKEYLHDSYVPFLTAYIQSVGHNEYYEQVLRVIATLDKQDLAAMPLADEKWYEIDDLQDYEIALTLFAPPDDQYSSYLNRHGGYWRFPELQDFCYLVNPYFPPADMAEEMQRSFEQLLRSYPSSSVVLDHLAAKMFGLPVGAISVGNGAAELICEVGEVLDANRIGVCLPTFEEYRKRFPNADLVEHSSDDPDFKVGLSDLEALAASTDALVLVNPDNPSGQCLSEADLFSLLDHMEEDDKRLILDESFVDFADPERCKSLLRRDVLERYPRLVIIRSISKSYGVPGCRLGVLATADTQLLAAVRSRAPVWNVNSFGEFFLQIVGKYQSAYNSGCEQLRTERSRFHKALSGVRQVRPIPSEANYLLCELSEPITAGDVARRLLREHRILIKDCSDKAGMMNRQYFRVAVKGSLENDRFVAALRQVLSEHPQRP